MIVDDEGNDLTKTQQGCDQGLPSFFLASFLKKYCVIR
jgi:hypothetical protein